MVQAGGLTTMIPRNLPPSKPTGKPIPRGTVPLYRPRLARPPEKQDNSWSIGIPGLLSLLTTHTMTGQVRGLREFLREDRPPVAIPFYAFRIMVSNRHSAIPSHLWTLRVWEGRRA